MTAKQVQSVFERTGMQEESSFSEQRGWKKNLLSEGGQQGGTQRLRSRAKVGTQASVKLGPALSVPDELVHLARKVTGCIPDPTFVTLLPGSHIAAKPLDKVLGMKKRHLGR